mgnify:CR=1 FL=1
MAKIRIYELARELNMKNKALLDKMAEMGISARSHMSSLEDETVAQIKRSLFGKKAAAVEVTRVRPTVIRRRKKTVTVEAEKVSEGVEPAVEVPKPPGEGRPAAAPRPIRAEHPARRRAHQRNRAGRLDDPLRRILIGHAATAASAAGAFARRCRPGTQRAPDRR